MSDLKLYTLEELKKMSAKDRSNLVRDIVQMKAKLTLNIRTGKEKQNHLINAWQKQIARIKTLDRKADTKCLLSNNVA